jgi:adenosylhomocysteine nucleosidase
MTEIAINLIVALPPEAKPINQHLSLVRDNRHDQYSLYRNGHINLVISGYGVQNSAAATTWLHQINKQRAGDIWINLGIAGHHSHGVGESFLANSIEDVVTGDSWAIETGSRLPCPSEKIYSVAKPDGDYNLDGVVEMEAAGFYRSALKCTTPDRIYCLKVISDNRNNPTNTITAKFVSQLIRERLYLLDEIIRTETNQ